MSNNIDPHTVVGVGGDFARVFDHDDYIAMVNAYDEASVVLRAHLILEEFLNIWTAKITGTEDLFAGVSFVPFKTKLVVSKNLGLDVHFVEVLDKFNEIRNRYSHRRKYSIEGSLLDSIKSKIDSIPSPTEMLPCDKFGISLSGVDPQGNQKEISYTWDTADAKKRIVIMFAALVLKLIQWMQSEFNNRGIKYKLVIWPNN